jgi:hypothetical protein
MTNTRINWKTTFATLLASPALAGKDRDVMNTTGAIISACKNNKLYTLLPIGGTAPIQVEERYLKGRK